MRARACLIGLAIVASACATTPGQDVRPPTMEEACNDYAFQLCDRESQCAPVFVAGNYGTADVCESVLAERCRSHFFAPGALVQPNDVERCATAISLQTCGDVMDGVRASACAFRPGARDVGAPCGSNLQCASGACTAPYQGCGTCVDTLAACPEGALVCAGGDCIGGACVPRAHAGEGCDTSGGRRCQSGTECTAGTCLQMASRIGDACTPFTLDCDGELGLECDGATLTCVATRVFHLGGACDTTGYCVDGAYCDGGTCRARASVGEDCSITPCAEPGVCVGGTCKTRDPASCG